MMRGVVVFETLLGRVEVPEDVVRKITSVSWSIYSNQKELEGVCPGVDMGYGDVMDFLGGSRDPVLLRRTARYILVYAENLVLSNHVYQRIVSPRGADGYLESMKPLLRELRRLYRLLRGNPTTYTAPSWTRCSACVYDTVSTPFRG